VADENPPPGADPAADRRALERMRDALDRVIAGLEPLATALGRLRRLNKRRWVVSYQAALEIERAKLAAFLARSDATPVEVWAWRARAESVAKHFDASQAGRLYAAAPAGGRLTPGPAGRDVADERDEFCYRQEVAGAARRQTLKAVRARPDWPKFDTENGVKDRARAYARRHGLDPPPKRRPGRPRKLK
jgi:hypothetical protein